MSGYGAADRPNGASLASPAAAGPSAGYQTSVTRVRLSASAEVPWASVGRDSSTRVSVVTPTGKDPRSLSASAETVGVGVAVALALALAGGLATGGGGRAPV